MGGQGRAVISSRSFTVRVRKEFEVQKENRTCQRLLGRHTKRDVRAKREVQTLYTGSLERQRHRPLKASSKMYTWF